MTRVSEKLDGVFRYTVLILFGVFVTYLTLLSLFSTSYYFNGDTCGFLVSDSPWKPLLLFPVIVLLVYIGRKIHVEKYLKRSGSRICHIELVCIFAVILYFVFSMQITPYGDQLAICNAAEGLSKYDFSLFAPGKYFDYYPFQSRIVVFLWGVFRIFGNSNYLAFQVMNAAAIAATLYLIAKIFRETQEAGCRVPEWLVLLALGLFWPYLLYATFIYGNVIGFAFIIAAVYALIRYCREHRIWDMALMSVCCGIGIMLKSSYQIFIVAIIVFLLMDLWQKRSVKNLAAILCVLLAIFAFGKTADILIQQRTGLELSEGTPMLSWVTMAFGENEDGKPVKYDGYNISVYLDHDRDTGKASEAAAAELKERFAHLTDTPSHFIGFMGRKIALEWNEPTFESIGINNRAYPQIEKNAFLKMVFQDDNRSILVKYSNLYQPLVLLGVLCFLFLRGRKAPLWQLFFALAFVGGFLFQLFWETQGQYTLVYFLVLIPYAVSGYDAAAEKIEVCMTDKRAAKKGILGVVMAVFVIAFAGTAPFPVLSDLFQLDDDDAVYTEKLQEIFAKETEAAGVIADGHYFVTSLLLPEYTISAAVPYSREMEEEEKNLIALRKADDENTGILEVYHEYDYDLLRIQSTQLLLSLSGSPSEGWVTVGQDYDYAAWKIIEMPEKGYAITYDKDYALTVSDGALTVQPFTGSEDQLWQFEKR